MMLSLFPFYWVDYSGTMKGCLLRTLAQHFLVEGSFFSVHPGIIVTYFYLDAGFII